MNGCFKGLCMLSVTYKELPVLVIHFHYMSIDVCLVNTRLGSMDGCYIEQLYPNVTNVRSYIIVTNVTYGNYILMLEAISS